MKYQVLSSLKHNKMLYKKGSEIELSDKEAQALLKDKVIQVPAKLEVVKPEPVGKEDKKEKKS